MVDWLTSRPAWLLIAGSLVFAVVTAFVARRGVRALVPADEADHVSRLASPLMPALGAAFGVLIALSLAGEAGYLRDAHDIVADEAAAASRLAWAATSPGIQTEPIHVALVDYLEATRQSEWNGTSARTGDARVKTTIATLERVVRAEAADPKIGTPASTELLASLDALTSGRRQRIAAASREIPPLYVITLLVGGVALIANAGALAFRSSMRITMLIVGLAAVVGLSMALLLALAGPWQGPLVVSGAPLDEMVRDLHTGLFG